LTILETDFNIHPSVASKKKQEDKKGLQKNCYIIIETTTLENHTCALFPYM
jgi:hypothetical protein